MQGCLRELSSQYSNYHISIGMGDTYDMEDDLYSVLQSAHIAALSRILCGHTRVLEYRKIRREYEDEYVSGFSFEFKKNLLNKMEIGDRENALQMVSDVFQNLRNCESADLYRIYSEVGELFLYLRGELLSRGLLDIVQIQKNGINWMSQQYFQWMVMNCDRISDLSRLLSVYINTEFDCIEVLQMTKTSAPVKIAQKYIQDNLSKQISLEEIAQAVNLSPSYFCTLFKEQMNIGLTDYIIQERIEKAKLMLRDSTFSIKEIAYAVGYADQRHFSKVFQKTTGMKPSAYKKLYE